MTRVVHFGYSDLLPGAGKASYRLHRALLHQGLDSKMVVSVGLSGDAEVHAPDGWRRWAARIGGRVDALATNWLLPRTGERSAGLVGSNLVGRVKELSPDIVQLHWIAGGLVRPAGLRKLPDVPVVWRLADEWAMHGSRHYSGDEPPGMFDRTLLRRKVKVLTGMGDLTVVAPSAWLAGLARNSPVFSGRRVEVIATGVDLEVWAPRDRREARRSLRLNPSRPVVLFGAAGGANPRKGWDLLQSATGQLDQRVQLVCFGAPVEPSGGRIVHVGRVNDEDRLRTLYSAADAMVVPSREENLPNSGIEALACGTPVVGFSIGGMSDLVEHGVNGWLAEPYDPAGLAEGIGWALDGDHAQAARRRAEERFDIMRQAGRYAELYADLLGRDAPADNPTP